MQRFAATAAILMLALAFAAQRPALCHAQGIYGRAEYGFWWTKGSDVPALVSISPDGTPRQDAGVIGTPGVEILDGNERFHDELRSGGKLTLGHWWTDVSAIEGSFLYVGGDGGSDFTIFSTGSPIVSRPFFNPTTQQEDAELVAYPSVLEGRVTVQTSSDLLSPDIYLRHRWREGERGSIDLLAGYRYFQLRESLTVTENLVSIDLGGVIPLGTTTDLQDRFLTENEFHGGEIGVVTEFIGQTFSLELLAKVAIGNLSRQVDIQGETVVQIPGLPSTTTPGGLLTQPTNINHYHSNRFAVLPEFGMTGKVLLTERWSLTAGYTLILLQDVVRASEQVDRSVNVSQLGGGTLVGDAHPRFALVDSDFWAQSINLGVEFNW